MKNTNQTKADACRTLKFGPTSTTKGGTVSSTVKKGNDLRIKGGR